MKRVLFISFFLTLVLMTINAYAPFNFESGDFDTKNFDEIMTYVDNSEEEKAKQYILNNNITSEELTFYLYASPDVIPFPQNIDYVKTESAKYGDLGLQYWEEKCNKRLAFLLQNGANAFEVQFEFSGESVTIADYLAICALLGSSEREYYYVSYMWLDQIEIIHSLSNDFNPLKDFKFFFDQGYVNGLYGFGINGNDSSFDVISMLIDFFGCEPSEEIFLDMLNWNYSHKWFEFAADLAVGWIREGYTFSKSTKKNFAEFVGKYFDKYDYYYEVNPNGFLKLLSDIGYDFSNDSYEILFDALKSQKISDEELKYVIEQQNAWNARNEDGDTLLMHIAAYTAPERGLVEFMLEGGSDITRLSRDRSNVLIFASKEFAPVENIEKLIVSGVDVSATNKDGYNALSILFKKANPSPPESPLFPKGGEFDFVDDYFYPLLELLISSGVHLNDQDRFQWTISGYIARAQKNAYYSNNKVFELLYENGLDFTSKSAGRSVTQIISEGGNTRLEDFLLDKGLL